MTPPDQEPIHQTWTDSDRFLPRRFVRPVQRFMANEAGSGVVMLVAAVVALLWVNISLFGESYSTFWHYEILIEIDDFLILEVSLEHIVNDGLMVLFFFVVGLEIKRELVLGNLRDPKAAALPVMGAIGGMVAPILIYLIIVWNQGRQAVDGWGIPVATDIAFTLGVLALLGRRVPAPAKIFLLALAIADDIGGILIIAIFYSGGLRLSWLALGVGLLGVMYGATRAGVRSYLFYVPAAIVVWYFFYKSGVHATIAGVLIAFITPARPMYSGQEYDQKARSILDMYPTRVTSDAERERVDYEAMSLSNIARESVSPLFRAEHALQPWVSYLVVPVFALANAGVSFGGDFVNNLFSNVSLGVAAGLVLGKTLGVTFFSYLAVRLGMARLPRDTSWRHLTGIASIAGIGFTVALFISALAFTDPVLGSQAKLGIFFGSLLAGLLGVSILFGAKSVHTPYAHPHASAEDELYEDKSIHPAGLP